MKLIFRSFMVRLQREPLSRFHRDDTVATLRFSHGAESTPSLRAAEVKSTDPLPLNSRDHERKAEIVLGVHDRNEIFRTTDP